MLVPAPLENCSRAADAISLPHVHMFERIHTYRRTGRNWLCGGPHLERGIFRCSCGCLLARPAPERSTWRDGLTRATTTDCDGYYVNYRYDAMLNFDVMHVHVVYYTPTCSRLVVDRCTSSPPAFRAGLASRKRAIKTIPGAATSPWGRPHLVTDLGAELGSRRVCACAHAHLMCAHVTAVATECAACGRAACP